MSEPARSHGDVPRVSIIFVNWNTRDLLLDALGSFLPLSDFAAEVIVVDNASQDGSADAVEERFPEVRLIRSTENLGFAGGNNLGFRVARAPLVLLLNTDVLVVGDAIPTLVEYAEAHPEVGIAGPRVLNRDRTLQRSYFRYPSALNHFLGATYLYKLFPRSSFFNRQFYAGLDPDQPSSVEVVSGCAFLVRREVLERIGGFDEGYFMYCEEADLCFRAKETGWDIHFAPGSGSVVHFGGESSRLASRRMFLEYRRSQLLFFRKHHGPLRRLAARAGMMLFLAVRVPYWAVRSLSGNRGVREKARGQVGNYLAGIRFLGTTRVSKSASRPAVVPANDDLASEDATERAAPQPSR